MVFDRSEDVQVAQGNRLRLHADNALVPRLQRGAWLSDDAPDRPSWTFDGNMESPTFGPSIRCFTTETTDDNDKPLPHPVERTLCHYFIKAGKIEFCGDSPHALAGRTVDLPDWPYAPGTYGGIDE